MNSKRSDRRSSSARLYPNSVTVSSYVCTVRKMTAVEGKNGGMVAPAVGWQRHWSVLEMERQCSRFLQRVLGGFESRRRWIRWKTKKYSIYNGGRHRAVLRKIQQSIFANDSDPMAKILRWLNAEYVSTEEE